MLYYINLYPTESFTPDIDISDDKYIESSFYDVYMMVLQLMSYNPDIHLHHLLLKHFTQEENYMIHRLMSDYIIDESKTFIIINLNVSKK